MSAKIRRAQLPNVIVIMADQMKATSLGVYGNRWCPTPSLERLSSSGVRCEYAFTPHPLCVPARVSLWTGRYPHQHGCRRNETLMPDDVEHAFRAWKNAGYRCALIGKNHCFQERDYALLFDTWCEVDHTGFGRVLPNRGMRWNVPTGGFRRAHREAAAMLTGPDRHLGVYAPECEPHEHSTGLVTEQTLSFLRCHGRGCDRPGGGAKPFALWVSLPAPHEPYIVPKRYFDRIDISAIEVPPSGGELMHRNPMRTRMLYRMLATEGRSEELKRAMAVYAANNVFIDESVGRILNTIEELGLRENTLVVFCSDHGDFAGEHGMMIKGGVFYDCLVRVPMIFSLPGRIPEGFVERSLVSLVDFIPTVGAVTGVPVLSGAAGAPIPACVQEVRHPELDEHPDDRRNGNFLRNRSDSTAATGTTGASSCGPRDAVFAEYGAGMARIGNDEMQQIFDRYSGVDALMHSLKRREAEGRRKMVRTNKWKYVYDPLGDLDELYDLEEDPLELNNIAGEIGHRETIYGMRELLLTWSIRTEDAVPVPQPNSNGFE